MTLKNDLHFWSTTTTNCGVKLSTSHPLIMKDDTDARVENDNFYWNVVVVVFSITVFFVDVGSDINLVLSYWNNNNQLYGCLTLTFVLLSSIVINVVSFGGFLRSRRESDSGDLGISDEKSSSCFLGYKILMHLLLLGPVYRNIQSLYYNCRMNKYDKKHPKNDYFSRKMLKVDAEICRLGLIEAFIECAPQLCLQLYVIIRNSQIIRPQTESAYLSGIPRDNYDHPLREKRFKSHDFNDLSLLIASQTFSIISSLVSMSVALTNNARYKRYVKEHLPNISVIGIVFQFLWNFFSIGSRILAVALFTSTFTFWCVLAMAIRWFVMSLAILTIWTFEEKKYDSIDSLHDTTHKPPPFHAILRAVLIRGPMYIFACVRMKNDPLLHHYLFYYTYDIVENSTFVALWCWIVDSAATWFFWMAIGAQFGGFLLGLSFMFVYFAYFCPEVKYLLRKKTAPKN